MMELFVSILKQLLVEETYAATAAELNHIIYASDKGIVLKIDGFNQKQPVSSDFWNFKKYFLFAKSNII